MPAPPVCDFGTPAPEFTLLDPTGKDHSLQSEMGTNGLLVAFICNHCPYVKAIGNRLREDSEALKSIGINTVAIMSNDYAAYPADAPEHMLDTAKTYGWTFPYLVDEDQSVARAFGAVCTPDFFGYNNAAQLQYRGRLDDAKMDNETNRTPELVAAMRQISETGRGPQDQIASMGCSIKWRA